MTLRWIGLLAAASLAPDGAWILFTNYDEATNVSSIRPSAAGGSGAPIVLVGSPPGSATGRARWRP